MSQGLQAHLAALCRLADESRQSSTRPPWTSMPKPRRASDQRYSLPRHRIGPEVRRLPQGLRGVEGQQGRGRRGAEAQAAAAGRGPEADAEGLEARAALHRAAAALQRGVAGEGAGRARHRPPFHLRGHHQHHPGAAVRAEDRRASSSPPRSAWSSPICWSKTSRTSSTPQYTARLEEELDEIEDGKEQLDRRARRVLQEVREGTPIRRKAHGEHQADGEAHRREVRTVRLAAGHQVGQARFVLRLQRLRQDGSQQLHLHQGKSHRSARPGFRRRRRRRRRKSICENCGTSHGAEARTLWAVHGLHRISRLQDHAPARSGARKCPTFRWTRSARSAAAICCCATAASASSSRAAAIPNASG